MEELFWTFVALVVLAGLFFGGMGIRATDDSSFRKADNTGTDNCYIHTYVNRHFWVWTNDDDKTITLLCPVPQ